MKLFLILVLVSMSGCGFLKGTVRVASAVAGGMGDGLVAASKKPKPANYTCEKPLVGNTLDCTPN